MKDFLLTPEGDLYIGKEGDIKLTDSVRQAVRIRLQWFFNEWRFSPQFGVPYYEDILIKKPDIARVRRDFRQAATSVLEVLDIKNMNIETNKAARFARVTFDVVTAEETYRDEVLIYA